jgi:chromosome partitioning protein
MDSDRQVGCASVNERGAHDLIDTDTAEPAQTIPHRPKQRSLPAVVMACGNMKGGVGKSATCASLASALARSFAVLAIDLDHQGQLGQDLGIELDPGDPSVGDWMLADVSLDPHAFIYESEIGVDVIPSQSEKLTAAAVSIRSDELDGLTRLSERIDRVRGEYDFIIVDLPAGLDTLTNVGLAATDVVLPIVTPDYASWVSGVKFIARVDQVRARLNPGVRLGPIVRNAYNFTSSPPEQQRLVDESINASVHEVWPHVIPRSEYISKARGLLLPAERAFAKQVAVGRYRVLAADLADWCVMQGI